jgi:hypothetical protein
VVEHLHCKHEALGWISTTKKKKRKEKFNKSLASLVGMEFLRKRPFCSLRLNAISPSIALYLQYIQVQLSYLIFFPHETP